MKVKIIRARMPNTLEDKINDELAALSAITVSIVDIKLSERDDLTAMIIYRQTKGRG